MNICPACGTEYEGEFCPNCGLETPVEAVCPNCGAPMEDNYCAACGYTLYEEPAPETGKPNILSTVLKYIPAGMFLLYSVLLFLLYLAPVSTSLLGSMNLYQATELTGAATALIVFAVFSLVFAVGGAVLLPFPFFDLGNIAEKPVKILRMIWKYLPFLFYFLIYSLACTLVFLSGTCSTLLIIFSLLFALFHAAAILVPKYLNR